MTFPRSGLRLAVSVALAVAVASGTALAQTAMPPAPPPAAAPGPAVPPPAAMPGPAVPSALKPGDAFGETVTLPDRTIVFVKSQTTWDTAFDTLKDSFKSLNEYLDKQGIKANGPLITIYTETDDRGFSFQAAAVVTSAPVPAPTGNIASGTATGGKALKFVHRGSYDSMDSTYEAITNYLDEKQLEAQDLFIEEYTTDPLKTEPANLIINVYVPIK